jgi:hypothetical protein
MVNYEVLELYHKDPNSEVHFKSRTHRQYFNIILLDFLKLEVFPMKIKCLEGLGHIPADPQFGNEVAALKAATKGFQSWLDQDVQPMDDGNQARKFWFPSLDSDSLDGEIALKIKRSEFIKICGNISKHNPLSLSQQAEVVRRIFERSSVTIDITQALLAMEDFYNLFHDDIFIYHGSTIAEFLNNIRLGIHEYLRQECTDSKSSYWDAGLKTRGYKFRWPRGLKNPFVRTIYWDLMNDILSGTYMKRFSVNKILKLRY